MEGKDFVVTFGQGQFGGLLRDSYVLFKNATDLQVRRWMSDKRHFGGVWSGTYTDLAAQEYLRDFAPTKLGEVEFAKAGNSEFDVDSYSLKTRA